MSTNEPPIAKQASKTNLVPQAILDAASKLFLQQGFGGTTMQDIAAEMGVTRTAVYYYYKNKDEILTSLTEGVTLLADQMAARLTQEGSAPVGALRALVLQHATLILSHPIQFRVVEHSERFLNEAQRKAAAHASRTLLDSFTTVINRGVQSGHFRLIEPLIAALSAIGMCNWSAWWFKPDGRKSIDDVAHQMADLALNAVVRTEPRHARGDVNASIRAIQEELDFLRLQAGGGAGTA